MVLHKETLEEEFKNESKGYIKELKICVTKLKNRSDSDLEKVVSRLCHTLEGNSLLVGRYDLAYFANKIMRLLDNKQFQYIGEIVDSMLNAIENKKIVKSKTKLSSILSRMEKIEEKKKEYQEQLKESEKKFRSLVSNIPGAVYRRRLDKYHTVEFISSNIKILTGYDAKLLKDNIKRSFISIVHPDDLKKLKKVFGVKEYNVEYKIINKNGETRWIQDRGIVSNEQGIKFLNGVLLDITNEKYLEELLKESEEKFKTIFNNVTVGIIGANPETRKFLIANPKICKMLGYKEKELLNLGISDIHPKKYLPYVFSQFEKQLKGKIKIAENIPVLKKNGEVIYCDISSSPQNILGFSVLLRIFNDVTKRKKTEEELKKSEFYLNSIRDSILVLDFKRRVISVNKAVRDLWGYSPKEMIGKSFTSFFPKKELLKHKQEMEVAVKTGKERIFDTEILTKKGEVIPVSMSGTSIFSEKELVGFIGVFRDITDIKNAEEKITKEAEFSSKVMNSIPYGFDIVDEDLKIKYMNKKFLKLFGKGAIGKKCYQVYKDNKKQCINCPLKKKIRVGETRTLVTNNVAGGKTFKITHTGIKLPDGEKGILEFFEEIK